MNELNGADGANRIGEVSVSDVALLAAVLCAVVLLSWGSVKWLIGYLVRTDTVDRPNERSMHSGTVPRGGGLVVVVLLTIALLLLSAVSSRSLLFLGLAGCLIAWATLGWSDDKLDLSPKLRLLIQFVVSGVTVVLFGWVDQVHGVGLGWVGPLFTLVGIVWMANLNNFMDGMDGLAASQAIIAGLTLGTWFLYLGDTELALLCTVLVAANYGFLLWNWQPARIFMGDVGSVTVGALYAMLMVIAANRYNLPVLSLGMVFAVFIGDATYTVLNRIRKGERFWLPHRSHFYQRAGLSGVKHARVVLIYIVMMVLCSLFATLSVLYRDIIGLMVGFTLVVLLLAAFWVRSLEREKNKRS